MCVHLIDDYLSLPMALKKMNHFVDAVFSRVDIFIDQPKKRRKVSVAENEVRMSIEGIFQFSNFFRHSHARSRQYCEPIHTKQLPRHSR